MNRKRFARFMFAIIIALTLSLASVVPNQAMIINRKLSGDMLDFGDVKNFKISPDGQYVVFCADRYIDHIYELFSVPIAGGEPVQLTDMAEGSHFTGWDAADYQISADSQWVVYRADQEETDKVELFSVPITGGTTTTLNATLVEDGDVYEFYITPQSIPPYGYVVVYRADREENFKYELYGVSLTNGEVGKYNGDLVTGGNVHSFKISPDGQWVVYLADQETNQVNELYSNTILGGGWEKLNDPIIYPGNVQNYKITPNSQGVVYTSNPDGILNKMQLYSNYITGLGDGPYELSDLTFNGASVSDFDVTPNSLGVVYNADQDTDEIDELYSNYITGGTPIKLSGNLYLHGDITSFAITPNNQGVVFMHKNTSEMEVFYELFSNLTVGGYSPIHLGTCLFHITPNS